MFFWILLYYIDIIHSIAPICYHEPSEGYGALAALCFFTFDPILPLQSLAIVSSVSKQLTQRVRPKQLIFLLQINMSPLLNLYFCKRTINFSLDTQPKRPTAPLLISFLTNYCLQNNALCGNPPN